MNWLNAVVDELLKRRPEGEIVVSSGVSPSGTYHLGTLREVLTAEVIMREVRRRGRQAKHLHVVDDLDVFRKVPVDVDDSFEKYLGMPLCDIPAPDGSDQSYADYFLSDLLKAAKGLHLDMEIIRAHEKYRSGFFVPAIEKTLEHTEDIKAILESISGHKVDDNWSPVQIVEDGYLKNRKFVALDRESKTITYEMPDGGGQVQKGYQNGDVKLNWRIDWPARWSFLGVDAEPFGRDHATKGGSYDTGVAIVEKIFGGRAPLPVPYNFINRTGDTKKMSKSAGDTITASQLLDLLPAEIVWFFMLRSDPAKLLFFDDQDTLMRLFDEFGELLAKADPTPDEKQLLSLCLEGVETKTISRIPFTHLVASYQAALKDADRTLEIISRTEHAPTVQADQAIIKAELRFIQAWLQSSAPEEVKFDLADSVDAGQFSDDQRHFLSALAEKVAAAPQDADGEWFHKAVYDLKDTSKLEAKELFVTLYTALIGKTAGPRAGWFLSMLPRDWLIKRLQMES